MDLFKDPTTLFIFKLAITFGLMASGFFVNRALSWSLRKLHPHHPEKARSQLLRHDDAEQAIYKGFWREFGPV